jgi:hypothetical protein
MSLFESTVKYFDNRHNYYISLTFDRKKSRVGVGREPQLDYRPSSCVVSPPSLRAAVPAPSNNRLSFLHLHRTTPLTLIIQPFIDLRHPLLPQLPIQHTLTNPSGNATSSNRISSRSIDFALLNSTLDPKTKIRSLLNTRGNAKILMTALTLS